MGLILVGSMFIALACFIVGKILFIALILIYFFNGQLKATLFDWSLTFLVFLVLYKTYFSVIWGSLTVNILSGGFVSTCFKTFVAGAFSAILFLITLITIQTIMADILESVKEETKKKIIITLTIIVLLVGLLFNYLVASKSIQIDYTQSKWLEIKGYKSKGYGVNADIIYHTHTKECEKGSLGFSNNGALKNYYSNGETTVTYDANTSKNDLEYTLRYPLSFFQGKCEFLIESMKLRMEEYNDLDIKKYPRNQTIRSSQILDKNVLSISYKKEDYRNDLNNDLNPEFMNIYCQRTIHYYQVHNDASPDEKAIRRAICNSTTNLNARDYIGVIYEISYLKKHTPLNVNILLSEDLKCTMYCDESEMQRGRKDFRIIKKMFEGESNATPSTETINTKFIPSIKLFENF